MRDLNRDVKNVLDLTLLIPGNYADPNDAIALKWFHHPMQDCRWEFSR